MAGDRVLPRGAHQKQKIKQKTSGRKVETKAKKNEKNIIGEPADGSRATKKKRDW